MWCVHSLIKTQTFDGSLWVYLHKKVHIELKSGAKLVHHYSYPAPHENWQNFKRELDHMDELDILKPCWSLNGHPPPSLFQKEIGGFDNALIYVHLIKQLCTNNTLYQSSQICLTRYLDIFFHQTWPILYIWAFQAQPRTLYYCHTICQVRIQATPHGTLMCSWICQTIYGGGTLWYWQH